MDWAKHFRERSKIVPKAIGGAFGSDDNDVTPVPGATFGADVGFGADIDFGADASVIKLVQAKLNALGMTPPLNVDGSFGPLTSNAIRNYQASKSLPVDGVVGPVLLKSLGITVPKSGKLPPLPTVQMPPIPGVKPAVTNTFVPFSRKFEGANTNYMYTDSKGLVTSGIGNLADNSPHANRGDSSAPQPWNMKPEAAAWPWQHSDGTAASSSEIQAEFQKMKAAWPRIQSTGCKSIATLFLSDEAVAKIVRGQMVGNQQILSKVFPAIQTWPADAQMAVHSLSWAWGPGFARVWGGLGAAFMAAVNAATPDFARAAEAMKQASTHEESINPGIVPRNAANSQMFANAAQVVDKGGKGGDDLWWPNSPELVGLVALGTGLIYWFVGGAAVILGAMALGHKHGVIPQYSASTHHRNSDANYRNSDGNYRSSAATHRNSAVTHHRRG